MKLKTIYLDSKSFFAKAVLLSLAAPLTVAIGCATATKFKTPEFDKVILKNGIKVYFIEDKSLPSFSIQSVVSSGSYDESKDKAGIARLTLKMLKEGSAGLSSEKSKDAFSALSSDFDFSIDEDYSTFKSSGLSTYSTQIVDLFMKAMFEPNFIASKYNKESLKNLEKLKEKQLAQITRLKEDASQFATQALKYQLYSGSSYSYPQLGFPETVKKIGLGDIKSFYEKKLLASEIQIAVTGYYDQDLKKKILDVLSKVNLKEKKLTTAGNFKSQAPKAKIIFIDQPNAKQAEIRIGHASQTRSYSEFIPLYIANSVVGSGDFNSRLMKEIRVKKGLVYGIYSYFEGFKNAGGYLISGSTRHEKIHEVINSALDIVKDVKKNGIKNEELIAQKSILSGQFPMKFETSESYIYQIMRYNVYGFEESYIKDFYSEIIGLDLVKANKVLADNLRPEDVVVVILGSRKKLTKDFKNLNLPVDYKSLNDALKY